MAEKKRDYLECLGEKKHKLTAEEASRGGKKSVESRKRKKTMREALLFWLDECETKTKNGETLSNRENITFALIKKAAQGDVAAFNSIRDTVGEKPVEEQKTDTTVTVKMDAKTEDFSK